MTAPGIIVFDLDDTLYLEHDFVSSGYAVVGEFMRLRLGVDDFSERAKTAFAAGQRELVFDSVLRELKCSPDDSLIAEAVAVYREHLPSIALAPDAERYLAASTGTLALLSDGFAQTQANKVTALGLDHRAIAPIVLTGAWGRDYWKPHPRGYAYIQSHFDLPPRCFTYVADNPTKDFIAPRSLGWRTVQIARPDRIHAAAPVAMAAEAVIATLDELDDCLARLGG